MRALRQANTHTGVDIITRADYDAIVMKSSTTLYIVVESVTANVTIDAVYVGTTTQDVLIGNDNAIVWIASGLTGFTNAAVPLANLV